jgi:hypothetical protein
MKRYKGRGGVGRLPISPHRLPCPYPVRYDHCLPTRGFLHWGTGVAQQTTTGSEGKAEAAIVPRPQALFVELQAARCSGWQLTSLVQRHARLVTTFTRHHRREDVVAEGEALT